MQSNNRAAAIRPTKQPWHTRRTLYILAAAWTVSLALLLALQVGELEEDVVVAARISAGSLIEKDLALRFWVATHGGVYVPITGETAPSLYLADTERRDVTTTDGQRLTLINPSYMNRLVHEREYALYGRRSHLTSLNPIRPENAPDGWEAEALRAFARGVPEVSEISRVEGVEYLRLIMPLRVEAACLECHAKQGYKLGNLRGGISAAVPLAPLQAMVSAEKFTVSMIFTVIWVLGLLGLLQSGRCLAQRHRQREQDEEFVRENERNLQLTLNSIGDGLIITDLKGQITRLNPVAETLVGWLAKDAVGRPLSEVFPLSEVPGDPPGPLLAKGEPSGVVRDAVLTRSNGTESRIAYSVAPIKDSDGGFSGTVVIFQDLTERIRLQEKLLKTRDLEAIALLAGGIAHEFNNLFTGLFGNIQLAMMRLDKSHPAYACLVSAASTFDAGANLTQQLLIFAKGGEPLLEPLDPGQVIRDSLSLSVKAENIKVVQALPDDLWLIRGDKSQLFQMLSHLISNSVQAMLEGGSLHIDAQNLRADRAAGLSGNYVVISIRDEGPGIPEDEVARIFDLFYTTKVGSKGLGLAIARRIVAKHNGHLSLDSKLGGGTTVTIQLPAAASSADSASAAPAETPGTSRIVPGHILVMDDEEMIRNILKEVLESWGYRVDVANDGKDALAKYIAAAQGGNPFDVVFMDLFVPGGMGGETAIKKLLALYPEAKAIVTSGYYTEAILANFEAYGFKGRLAKPFHMDALQKELARVIHL